MKFRSVGDPVLYLQTREGFDRAGRAAASSTIWRASIAVRLEEHRRPGDRHAHRAVRDGLPHAVVGAGADRSLERAGARVRAATARSRASPAPSRRTACWRGGWPSAESASSSSSIAAGISTTTLPKQIVGQCRDTDQASAALVTDLKQRGLLDDTLVVWGGEFGRTVYCQGKLTADDYGRDHHPRCFTIWLAGGGVKPGLTYGETDDYSYNIAENPVHVHDLHATILHFLGIDHTKLDLQVSGPAFPADRCAWEGRYAIFSRRLNRGAGTALICTVAAWRLQESAQALEDLIRGRRIL